VKGLCFITSLIFVVTGSRPAAINIHRKIAIR
jgi:hypothetical protein